MKYHILTLFPEMIEQGLHTSILGRAINNGYISLETTNIRDFSANKFNRVDDYPYGGGAGMVMEAEPVFRAYQSVAEKIGKKPRTVYLTPQGKVLNQTMVEELALEDDLVLLCGHYEGIDDRVLQEVVTDYISIGDYVLTGGELGAMVLVDAVSRFVPGVLSNEESSQFESLQDNLLEYPHYTRPETWHEKKVPEVLLSGDHKKIEAWRHEASLVRTAERRPDLLENAFQISCACNEKEESSAWAHDLLAGMTRYGVSLDLGRKKIRKQKNLFDDHDLLILQLPGTLEEGMKAKSEYIRSFAGKETPLVFLCPAGFSEEEEKLEEQLEKNGFRLVARLTGIPSADGLQRFSFALEVIPYMVCVDEFQHKVFENIGMTAKERRAIWHQLELTYMPWRNYDGHKFLEEGGFWMQKQHIFVNPFYYIDYALAQICAFQFFERSKKEPEKAWDDYYRLCQAGGSKGYFALLELAGLKNPFVDGTVEEVVAGLKPYLKRKVKYTIRPVKEEDLKKVAEVEALCFPAAEAAGYEDFMERYKTCKNSFFVAETEDGEIAGFCNGCCADTDYLADALYHDATLHNPDGDYQMIFGLDVNPKFQKQGIGEALMRHMVKSAGERDKKAVVLTCKDHMIPFYKRIGYEYIELSDSTHGGAKWHKMMYRF